MIRSLLLAAACALLLLPAAAQADDAPLPVPYGPAALLAGGATPDAAPGVNDWSCKPSAAHPRPVVLVHGLLATLGTNWQTFGPLLKNNGFCVFGLSYGKQDGLPFVGGLQRMEDSSAELAALVDRVLAATGAAKVDLLGHSEGTVMPRWYLKHRGGAAKVDKYVQMTPLWDGTQLAGIGTLSEAAQTLGLGDAVLGLFDGVGCGSCPEFAKGSDYLDDVNGAPGGPAVPGITYTEIATRYDELVIPYESGFLDAPNVTNILLQDVCATDVSEHLAVAYSPTVAQLVLNALDPAHARAPQCTTTTPLGTPSPPEVGLNPPSDPAPVAAADSGTPGACTRAAIRVGVRALLRRGERLRSVTVRSGGREVASRRGTSRKGLRVPGLRAGRKTALRVRLVTSRGTRTVTVRRTARC